ncbi:MAG: hypothetical protein ABF931_05715 [Acetobacter pasteurianus]|uniref:hypothetical protein n=1 Tax=Acetobacter pasteurianus TaxID=438 RepID=UPI0002FFFF80|nr:hypothetical protein [Acetobacter pasteurianus]
MAHYDHKSLFWFYYSYVPRADCRRETGQTSPPLQKLKGSMSFRRWNDCKDERIDVVMT